MDRSSRVRKSVFIGMMGAVSTVLMMFNFSVPFVSGFLKMQFWGDKIKSFHKRRISSLVTRIFSILVCKILLKIIKLSRLGNDFPEIHL